MPHTSSSPRPALSRRSLLRAGLAAGTVPLLPAALGPVATATARPLTDVPRVVGGQELRALEAQYGTRLGVYARNLVTGVSMRYRHAERFPMCSVFKSLAGAAVLRDLDRDGEVLDRRIFYPESDLPNSDITRANQPHGMTVRELCDAAIRFSDNLAGNLLLSELGGPGAITRFARSLGDHRTRLDRWETELNTAYPHDPRDTTTPAALAATYTKLLVGDALAAPDRELLKAWMLANTTSGTRFRAGLPAGWLLADKTGGGERGALNDAGIAWNPDGVPIVIIGLSHVGTTGATGDNKLLADLARLVSARL